MEKKNTILLTVIAVTTLLVAVVGATFAYYTVSTVNSTNTTTFTANGNHVGAITLTSPNTSLTMTITPTDMAIANKGSKFYALVPGAVSEAPTTSSGHYGTSNKNYTIAQADLVGGNEETAYTCTANLIVTLTNTSGSMGAVLETGDAILYFTTDQTTMSGQPSQTLDLSTLKTSGSTTYPIVYSVNGRSSDTRIAYIKADLEINNLDKDQRYLAGENIGVTETNAGSGTAGATLTVTIQSTEFKCTIDNVKAN